MHPILRNILAVIFGLAIGSIVNMVLIGISNSIIPPPEGAITTTMNGLKESIHLFKPIHYLMPFLAHALGTLAGAIITTLIATHKQKKKLAIAIACWFLVGGIIMAFILPSPIWFIILDLALAYIPMSIIANKIATHK
jgi:hypothetical protein